MKTWKDEKRTRALNFSFITRDFIGRRYFSTDDITDYKLVSDYRKLNDNGKTEALKRIEELTEVPKYTQYLNSYE